MATKTTKPSTNGHAPKNRVAALLKEADSKGPIEIQRVPMTVIRVPIIGTAPLLMAKFSDKSKRQMLEAQMGKKNIKQPKDPKQLFEDAQYRLGKGWGMPAVCFKAAIVGAARLFETKNLSMTALKVAIYVKGEGIEDLVKLECKAPEMHEGTVRNASGVADLRYRPLFENWKALLEIRYLPSMLSFESVLALVDAAGLGGVGDWRPSSPKCFTGHFGTFEIDESRKVEQVKGPKVASLTL